MRFANANVYGHKDGQKKALQEQFNYVEQEASKLRE